MQGELRIWLGNIRRGESTRVVGTATSGTDVPQLRR